VQDSIDETININKIFDR